MRNKNGASSYFSVLPNFRLKIEQKIVYNCNSQRMSPRIDHSTIREFAMMTIPTHSCAKKRCLLLPIIWIDGYSYK